MKILITGGAGFIGSHLADRYISDGHKVVIVDNFSTGREENIPSSATVYNACIQDTAEIERIFCEEKPDLVSHHAAHVSVRNSLKNPKADAEENIMGGLNILEAMQKSGCQKMVFASTGGTIYGNASVFPTPETAREMPLSPYAISKYSFENYLRCYSEVFGISSVVLRYANIYGPRQRSNGEAGVISIFLENIQAEKSIHIHGNGEQTRDYLFVSDLVEAHVGVTQFFPLGFHRFNVGSAQEISVNMLFSEIKRQYENRYPHVHLDCIHDEAVAGELLRSSISFTSIKETFGWEPKISMPEGIRKTMGWAVGE
ncbi:MAG: NAD-dependent epimerase/dehydratase family protein [Candidatus Peregrinibacteria bacterium]